MSMFDQQQQMMGGFPGFNYTGMNQQQATKFKNTLTPEQIKMLMQNSEQFSLSITQEEMFRAYCNHRNEDGTGDMLSYDPVTGEARCMICGYKFRPIEPEVSPQEIADDVARIQDILQTIKLMYIDLPPQSAIEFFPIIALLDKVPKLFEYAVKNMTKHEAYNWQYNSRNMGAINLFNNLQNMFGGMSMMGSGMGQPNQQPTGPMANPVFGMMGGGMSQPNQPNAFGYPGASMMGGISMPNQPNAFQFSQQQPTGPNVTVTPVADGNDDKNTATVTQTVTA